MIASPCVYIYIYKIYIYISIYIYIYISTTGYSGQKWNGIYGLAPTRVVVVVVVVASLLSRCVDAPGEF